MSLRREPSTRSRTWAVLDRSRIGFKFSGSSDAALGGQPRSRGLRGFRRKGQISDLVEIHKIAIAENLLRESVLGRTWPLDQAGACEWSLRDSVRFLPESSICGSGGTIESGAVCEIQILRAVGFVARRVRNKSSRRVSVHRPHESASLRGRKNHESVDSNAQWPSRRHGSPALLG